MLALDGGEDFGWVIRQFRKALLAAPEVEVGEWQAIRQGARDPMNYTREVRDAVFTVAIPLGVAELVDMVHPNLPWAEDHFQERVSSVPLNPPPSEAYWPFAVQGNAAHKEGEQFSHTYPERFWPKFANEGQTRPNGRQVFVPHNGIRYEYGDLADVVSQIARSPGTRQAYLPVWFPEDTGAVQGQRVPCTLGYHFLARGGALNLTYFIRSCDFVRHFPDDVYMAARLMQWVSWKLRGRHVNAVPGQLCMHMDSLHIFRGDFEPQRRIQDGG